ncbi:ATP-dependent Clp protease ATP-binding subunit [Macrococcoides goetzii]|nr:ATP-dependent Clp protease ATP-binding subunit [Macrococcus goetzii]TDM41553.1 ATP-dependent Clp protease ATP-binding subunit [Macrococcus goetzii]
MTISNNLIEKRKYKFTRQCHQALQLLNDIDDKEIIETQDVLSVILSVPDTGAGHTLGGYSIVKSKVSQAIDDVVWIDKREKATEHMSNDFDSRRKHRNEILNAPIQFVKEKSAHCQINNIHRFISIDVMKAMEFAEEMRIQLAPDHGIDTEWLLIGMVQNSNCNAYHLLNKLVVENDRTYHGLRLGDEIRVSPGFHRFTHDGGKAERQKFDETDNNRWRNKLTNPDFSLLDEIAVDITKKAKNNELPKVIGRDEEIAQIELVLARRNKNNVALIGPGGVGKSAIAEGLAIKIAHEEIPSLAHMRILQLSMNDIHSRQGLSYHSDMILKFIEEMKREKDVILFIDEIHMLGRDKTLVNALKPIMARGDFRIIGATTPQEWGSYIAEDTAFARRFEQVQVDEPSLEDTEMIVANAISAYENFHKLNIPLDVIETSIYLAHKYLEHERMPDSVFTLIDNASTICKLENQTQTEIDRAYYEQYSALKEELAAAKQIDYNEEAEDEIRNRMQLLQQKYNQARNDDTRVDYNLQVTKEHLKKAIEYKSVTTVNTIDLLDKQTRQQQEFNNLKNLIENMKAKIIGQSEAVEAVAKAVIRSKTGFRDHTKPAGVFMFLGTTGVGKTETAKVLAEMLYGDSDSLIRFDMSEYQMSHEVSKLIGAPPGFIGYGKSGLLTNAVKKNPKAILLFDEVEKAHQKVFDTLLQVFDDGRLTDSLGNTIDFKDTLIILTSNLGASSIRNEKPMGFGNIQRSELDYALVKQETIEAVQEFFRPEFINRIDELITFKPFSKKEIFEITALMIEKETKNINKAGYSVHFDDAAIQFIADKYYDPINGARPIKRGITKSIQDQLSELLINDILVKGDKVHVTSDGNNIQMTVEIKNEAI